MFLILDKVKVDVSKGGARLEIKVTRRPSALQFVAKGAPNAQKGSPKKKKKFDLEYFNYEVKRL